MHGSNSHTSEIGAVFIFISGPSRSGTAMLRSSLNRHPNIHIAGETHYFDDLRVRLAPTIGRPLNDCELGEAAAYFCALSHRPYGHGGDPALGHIAQSDLVARATELGGTADAFFEAYVQLEAERFGKGIVGEKTPRHIFRIGEMLSAFPQSRMICMTRDPRAVTASYRNWRNQGGFDFDQDPGHLKELEREERRAANSYHPATIGFLWRAQMNAALLARARYGDSRVRIERYEDIVERPEVSLRQTCDWLGISFKDSMLDVPMHNSSYSRFSESAGISKEAVTRWKGKLAPEEVVVIERICARDMAQLSYDRSDVSSAAFSECLVWLKWPYAIMKAIMANRSRMGNLGKYVLRRLRLAIGR